MGGRLIFDMAQYFEKLEQTQSFGRNALKLVALALVFGGLGYFLVSVVRSRRTAPGAWRRRSRWVVPWAAVSVWICVYIFFVVGEPKPVLTAEQCRAWLATGDYQITRGKVSLFTRSPHNGNPIPMFRVNGREFVQPLLTSFLHDETLRTGDRVRVVHHGTIVLQIEKFN
jgi:hypothetical protein